MFLISFDFSIFCPPLFKRFRKVSSPLSLDPSVLFFDRFPLLSVLFTRIIADGESIFNRRTTTSGQCVDKQPPRVCERSGNVCKRLLPLRSSRRRHKKRACAPFRSAGSLSRMPYQQSRTNPFVRHSCIYFILTDSTLRRESGSSVPSVRVTDAGSMRRIYLKLTTYPLCMRMNPSGSSC